MLRSLQLQSLQLSFALLSIAFAALVVAGVEPFFVPNTELGPCRCFVTDRPQLSVCLSAAAARSA